MAIRKKIEKTNFNSVISKGGHVAADIHQMDKVWTTMCLRITSELIRNIDEIKSIGTSRNAWILEAIQEKLSKQK
jgi:hypothetical protein